MKMCITTILIIFLLISPLKVDAQTSLTTNATNSGVIVKEEDGVRYLTTEVSPNSTNSAPTRSSTTNLGTGNFNLTVPAGFFTDVEATLNRLLRVVLAAAAILTLMYLIFGAFKWITSGGDKSKTESARNTLTAAVIGLIIVASSYAILLLVLRFLGYESLEEVLEQATPIIR